MNEFSLQLTGVLASTGLKPPLFPQILANPVKSEPWLPPEGSHRVKNPTTRSAHRKRVNRFKDITFLLSQAGALKRCNLKTAQKGEMGANDWVSE